MALSSPPVSCADISFGASPPPMDPVTRYLARRGLATETAYLAETAFELGTRVVSGALVLTYRYVVDGTLLLCDVAAQPGSDDVSGALRRLVSLIHTLERDVPEVRQVCGLVAQEDADPSRPDAGGARLLALYRRLGAECRPLESGTMVAVTYPMRRGNAP